MNTERIIMSYYGALTSPKQSTGVDDWFISSYCTWDLPFTGEIMVGFLERGWNAQTDNLCSPFGPHSRLYFYLSDCRLLSTERCVKAGLSTCWGSIWPDGHNMSASHTLASVSVFFTCLADKDEIAVEMTPKPLSLRLPWLVNHICG